MSSSNGHPFSAAELIAKKRDGHALTTDELGRLISGFMDGSVADYQMSAFAMAVFLRGMTFEETVALTLAMRDSGKVMDFSRLPLPKVDKHSTGGVGDKVSICLAPIVAACGVAVPMMSGRGLGHTGGTLDKLEAIPGLRVALTARELRAQMRTVGCALIGQTEDFAPADKRLYALRDVTGTVESIPLITSSILSKKLAEGIDALVLDVKVGKGAFMKTETDARKLARSLVRVGRLAGKRVSALLTDMNAPIGFAVGNALETIEALEVLHGEGPQDLTELTYALGEEMLKAGGITTSNARAQQLMRDAVRNGDAARKMKEIVGAQGGDSRVIDEPDRLQLARHRKTVTAERAGFVKAIDPLEVGYASMGLGAGRMRAEDTVDAGAGIRLHVCIGDRVRVGDALATLYSSRRGLVDAADRSIAESFKIGSRRPPVSSRILEAIRR